MEMYLSILGGLVLLVAGGEMLVRSAVAIAQRLGVSPLLIGLTLVGFGTSTPELVTSLTAALEGAPGISVGNVLGSNIANILLILGFAALIYPIRIEAQGFRRDATWLIASALLLLALVMHGAIGRLAGSAMLAALAAYIFHIYHTAGSAIAIDSMSSEADGERAAGPARMWLTGVTCAAGIAATILGANLLVDGAVALARQLAISETIIGLTIVAVGTSLPELVTSLVAAWRRHSDIAYGNVVGSNIYNILFILGVTTIAQPIPIPAQIAALDIWIMLAATALLVIIGASSSILNRREGFGFLAAYAAYVWYLMAFSAGEVAAPPAGD